MDADQGFLICGPGGAIDRQQLAGALVKLELAAEPVVAVGNGAARVQSADVRAADHAVLLGLAGPLLEQGARAYVLAKHDRQMLLVVAVVGIQMQKDVRAVRRGDPCTGNTLHFGEGSSGHISERRW